MRLEGKVCIVVGGGQTPGATIGNCKATALRFAREGANVVVADRNLEAAAETVEEFLRAGGTGLAVRTDVTDEAQVRALVERCVERFGRLAIASLYAHPTLPFKTSKAGVTALTQYIAM
ncbi:hypothetical protein GCM10023165_31900 [Variovorax defluvii]|uniref:SDR family NAD(P)-dependent oxidoreductase n=2 Tax=Variovorax defluvii TaxID=913761 RepID=A0ABP8HY26_9BURK